MKSLAKIFGFGADKNQAVPEVVSDVPAAVESAAGSDEAETDTGKTNDIHYIPVASITPNPFQPRKTFHDESLQELAESIKEFGVIQPLLVRGLADRYELVAGERRLRASKLAGLNEVPVIIKNLSDKEMAELAMIENLQREDLHFLEEAEGFQQLIANFGFTQEELAKRVSKSQSTIANKLRLLRLAPDIRSMLVEKNLTERHARSLLRIEDPKLQRSILETVEQKGMNVRETEVLIEETLSQISKQEAKKARPKQNVIKIIKDIRIFINTITKIVGEMKKTGLDIHMEQHQDDEKVTIKLDISKQRTKKRP